MKWNDTPPRYERQHDKTYKMMCAHWRLRSAWSSTQSDQRLRCLHSEDSDQIGQMPRLIWVFAGGTCHFVGFVHAAAHMSIWIGTFQSTCNFMMKKKRKKEQKPQNCFKKSLGETIIFFNQILIFLCPATRKWRGIMLYPPKFWVSVSPSVCLSVRPSVRPSVRSHERIHMWLVMSIFNTWVANDSCEASHFRECIWIYKWYKGGNPSNLKKNTT